MKRPTEALRSIIGAVGEHSGGGEGAHVSGAGAARKANVGMSNDKQGHNPCRRKTKVSHSTFDGVGLAGD
jgi:hypothetical protein